MYCVGSDMLGKSGVGRIMGIGGMGGGVGGLVMKMW